MPAETTSFYTRETDRFVLNVKTPEKKEIYLGVERRMESRRKGRDRRVDIRFNLTKSDRRENQGRREEDELPSFW
jgi:hypothetical protein